MPWYNLYEVSTGKLLSNSQKEFTNSDPTKDVKITESRTGVWDQNTLDYIPRPEKKVESKLDFTDRFTFAEFIGLIDAANTNPTVAAFMKKMDYSEFIDRADVRTIEMTHAIEALGLIATGRASEILNG